jgi:phage tail sheath protein FI
MSQPYFGLQFIQVDDQAKPVLGANMDVIGIIGPCSTADATIYPLNTPVLVYSNDVDKLTALGTDGYIPDAINGINAQLADFQVAAQIVIVRTDYGTDANANLKLQQTISKVMGNSILQTGVWAFTKAPNMLYCTPRLICAPGYTGQQANSLNTLNVNTVGQGYKPGAMYQLTFAPGGGETNGANLIQPVAHVVAEADGSIHNQDITIDSWGAWMTVAPLVTVPPPDGPPITALAASGSMIFNQQPGIGATINLNGSTVTFVSGTPVGNQVQIGANLSATLNSLVTFLNSTADTQISKCTYTLVTGTINIVDDTAGASGNSFTLGTTVTGLSLSGPTLTGGRDAIAATQCTMTATMALGANPVCAALPAVLDNLIGVAVVESAGISQIADENWRTTMNHQRLIAVSGGVKIMDPVSSNIIVVPRAPREIGLAVARDFATGAPFHSWANQPIQGIVGPARTVNFNLTDPATEGQQLLAANIGIIARGLIGIESAISSGGFISITLDNVGDDPLWQMINVKRGRDYIHLSLMPALRTYLGRANIDRQTVHNVITTINDFLGVLKAREQIIDGHATFRGALNSANEIRLGHLTVGFVAEEPPVLKLITTMSARYKPAIDQMVAQLEQQLNVAA